MTTTAAPPPALRTPRRKRRTRIDDRGWLFVAPFAVVFALVFLAPLVYSIYLSLFREQLIGGNAFVGFDNYIAAFQDEKFWDGLIRVSIFLVVQVPIMLILALGAALAIAGFTAQLFMTNANSMVQLTSAPEVRGRVMALYGAVFMGGTPVGAPIIGWIGQEYGARWTLIGGGMLTILGVLLSAALFLREFAGGRPWAHLDIAGPGRSTSEDAEITRGATGYGARLLLDWLTA